MSDCIFNLIKNIVNDLLDLHDDVDDNIEDDLLSFTFNLFIIYFKNVDQ